MANLRFSDKYTDGFWRLAPIPALVIAGAVTVALRPSPIAVVASLLLAVVSGLPEALIWHRLRLRWKDLRPEAVGTLLEPNRQREMLIASILLLVAILAKAFVVAGGVTTDALLAAGIIIALYAALVGADILSKRK